MSPEAKISAFRRAIEDYYDELASPSSAIIKDLCKHMFGFRGVTFSEESKADLMVCVLTYIDCLVSYCSQTDITRKNIFAVKTFYSCISNIFTSLEMRNLFLEKATQPIFSTIIESCMKAWYGKELLRVYNDVIHGSSRDIRQKMLDQIGVINLYKLIDLLSVYGDYEFQTVIVETVFRICNKNKLQELSSGIFPESQDLSGALLDIDTDSFDEDVRVFLNKVNSKRPNLFSVVSQMITLDQILFVESSQMKKYHGIWLDFDQKDCTISWSCDKNIFDESKLESDDESIENITLFTSHVRKVKLDRSKESKQRELIVTLKLDGPCFATTEEAQLVIDNARVLKFVIRDQERIGHLVKSVFPVMFGKNYLSKLDSQKRSSEKKKSFRPLNVKFSDNKKNVAVNNISSTTSVSFGYLSHKNMLDSSKSPVANNLDVISISSSGFIPETSENFRNSEALHQRISVDETKKISARQNNFVDKENIDDISCNSIVIFSGNSTMGNGDPYTFHRLSKTGTDLGSSKQSYGFRTSEVKKRPKISGLTCPDVDSSDSNKRETILTQDSDVLSSNHRSSDRDDRRIWIEKHTEQLYNTLLQGNVKLLNKNRTLNQKLSINQEKNKSHVDEVRLEKNLMQTSQSDMNYSLAKQELCPKNKSQKRTKPKISCLHVSDVDTLESAEEDKRVDKGIYQPIAKEQIIAKQEFCIKNKSQKLTKPKISSVRVSDVDSVDSAEEDQHVDKEISQPIAVTNERNNVTSEEEQISSKQHGQNQFAKKVNENRKVTLCQKSEDKPKCDTDSLSKKSLEKPVPHTDTLSQESQDKPTPHTLTPSQNSSNKSQKKIVILQNQKINLQMASITKDLIQTYTNNNADSEFFTACEELSQSAFNHQNIHKQEQILVDTAEETPNLLEVLATQSELVQSPLNREVPHIIEQQCLDSHKDQVFPQISKSLQKDSDEADVDHESSEVFIPQQLSTPEVLDSQISRPGQGNLEVDSREDKGITQFDEELTNKETSQLGNDNTCEMLTGYTEKQLHPSEKREISLQNKIEQKHSRCKVKDSKLSKNQTKKNVKTKKNKKAKGSNSKIKKSPFKIKLREPKNKYVEANVPFTLSEEMPLARLIENDEKVALDSANEFQLEKVEDNVSPSKTLQKLNAEEELITDHTMPALKETTLEHIAQVLTREKSEKSNFENSADQLESSIADIFGPPENNEATNVSAREDVVQILTTYELIKTLQGSQPDGAATFQNNKEILDKNELTEELKMVNEEIAFMNRISGTRKTPVVAAYHLSEENRDGNRFDKLMPRNVAKVKAMIGKNDENVECDEDYCDLKEGKKVPNITKTPLVVLEHIIFDKEFEKAGSSSSCCTAKNQPSEETREENTKTSQETFKELQASQQKSNRNQRKEVDSLHDAIKADFEEVRTLVKNTDGSDEDPFKASQSDHSITQHREIPKQLGIGGRIQTSQKSNSQQSIDRIGIQELSHRSKASSSNHKLKNDLAEYSGSKMLQSTGTPVNNVAQKEITITTDTGYISKSQKSNSEISKNLTEQSSESSSPKILCSQKRITSHEQGSQRSKQDDFEQLPKSSGSKISPRSQKSSSKQGSQKAKPSSSKKKSEKNITSGKQDDEKRNFAAEPFPEKIVPDPFSKNKRICKPLPVSEEIELTEESNKENVLENQGNKEMMDEQKSLTQLNYTSPKIISPKKDIVLSVDKKDTTKTNVIQTEKLIHDRRKEEKRTNHLVSRVFTKLGKGQEKPEVTKNDEDTIKTANTDYLLDKTNMFDSLLNATISTVSSRRKKRKLYDPNDLTYLYEESITTDIISNVTKPSNIHLEITDNQKFHRISEKENENILEISDLREKGDDIKPKKRKLDDYPNEMKRIVEHKNLSKLEKERSNKSKSVKDSSKKTPKGATKINRTKNISIRKRNSPYNINQNMNNMLKNYDFADEVKVDTSEPHKHSFSFDDILESLQRELTMKSATKPAKPKRQPTRNTRYKQLHVKTLNTSRDSNRSLYTPYKPKSVLKCEHNADISSPKRTRIASKTNKQIQKVDSPEFYPESLTAKTETAADEAHFKPTNEDGRSKINVISNIVLKKRENINDSPLTKRTRRSLKTDVPVEDRTFSDVFVEETSPVAEVQEHSLDADYDGRLDVSQFERTDLEAVHPPQERLQEIKSWIHTGRQDKNESIVPNLLRNTKDLFIMIAERERGPISGEYEKDFKVFSKITEILEKHVDGK